MTHHVLKCHPPMYHAVVNGTKPFEVRKDDRAFQTGDTVELEYYDPNIPGGGNENFNKPMSPVTYEKIYPKIKRKITFVLRGGQYGIEPGYVVLALKEIETDD